MTKKEKMNKRISKIFAVVASVVFLLLIVAVPSSAYSFGGQDPGPAGSNMVTFETFNPIKSITAFSNVYTIDGDAEGDAPYYNVSGGYYLTPMQSFPVYGEIIDELKRYKESSTNYNEIDFASYGVTSVESFNQNYSESSMSRVIHNVELEYYKTYLNYDIKDIDLENPLLRLQNNFTINENSTEDYTTLSASDAVSYRIEFEANNIQNQDVIRPSLQFAASYLPDNTTCQTRIMYSYYDKVEGADGVPELHTVVQDLTYNQSSWRSRICYLLPTLGAAVENRVYVSFTCDVIIKDNTGNVVVPHNFVLRQPVALDTNNDILIDLLNSINRIVEYKPITSITSWLGETVGDFFDIELLPNFRLSSVLGIAAAVSVTIWILKLMAGG